MFKPGCGLINGGNTCYLNSTLQAMLHCPEIEARLSRHASEGRSCPQKKHCLICDFAFFVKLSKERRGSAVYPKFLIQKLRVIAPHLQAYRQEDAHELLVAVLDKLEEREKRCRGVPKIRSMEDRGEGEGERGPRLWKVAVRRGVGHCCFWTSSARE